MRANRVHLVRILTEYVGRKSLTSMGSPSINPKKEDRGKIGSFHEAEGGARGSRSPGGAEIEGDG